jgi:hypothetical protein
MSVLHLVVSISHAVQMVLRNVVGADLIQQVYIRVDQGFVPGTSEQDLWQVIGVSVVDCFALIVEVGAIVVPPVRFNLVQESGVR